jgi:hypothetical protein
MPKSYRLHINKQQSNHKYHEETKMILTLVAKNE